MPPADRTYWMLITSAETFETWRARGFADAVAGKDAAQAKPGDRVVSYLFALLLVVVAVELLVR